MAPTGRASVLGRGSAPAPGITGPPPPGTAGLSGRDATTGWIRTLVAMLLLGVATPLVVVDWTRTSAPAGNVLLAFGITVFAAARLSRIIGTGRPDVVRAFFYVFVYVFMGVAALAQVVSGRYPQDARSYPDDVVTEGLVVVLVGLVAFELGWFLHTRSAGRRAPAPARPDRRWSFSRPRAVLLGIVALVATGYQVYLNGIASFFLSRKDTTTLLTGADSASPFYMADNKTVGLLSLFVTQVPLFVALFVILYCRYHRLWPAPRNLVTDAVWRLFIGALVAGNLVINNPIGNARFWTCLLAFSFLSIYLHYTRPVAIRTYVVLALSILLFVFTALDAFRYSTSDFRLSGPGESLVSDASYGMFQMELNGVGHVAANGHTRGAQALGSVFGFVPRSLWDGKPIPTGQVIDPKYARAASMWTEFQVDFGVLGVLVLFVLVGVGAAWLTRRTAGARPGVLHALVPVLAVFQIFLLRGSLMPATGQLYQLAAVFLVLVGVHRVTTARDRPGVPPDARTVPS